MLTTKNKIRIVTAASLFDGHDASINIMRRILQSKGAEIIHLGHNRSAKEIVETAIEEDVQGIAITSYQGGHIEFFKYIKDLLNAYGYGHIKIFGGGGGTILPQEIDELHAYGITRIYSPDDGRKLGLDGMIAEVIEACDFSLNFPVAIPSSKNPDKIKDIRSLGRAITMAENGWLIPAANASPDKSITLGITGTGGAGKSSVTDELVRRFLRHYPELSIAVLSIDPSKKKTGGALLGDRIRMNAINHPRTFMRSLATREENAVLSKHVQEAIDLCKQMAFDLIIVESAGVGQSDASILSYCQVSMYVMTPEYGAASQLEKINMLDYADIICINKFDKSGSLDALNDVRKQYRRSHLLWETPNEDLPIVGTVASQFNDAGMNNLFSLLQQKMAALPIISSWTVATTMPSPSPKEQTIIPPKRVRYLAEIADAVRQYNHTAHEQAKLASTWYQLTGAQKIIGSESEKLNQAIEKTKQQISYQNQELINNWPELTAKYQEANLSYEVRNKVLQQPIRFETLSGTQLQKLYLPLCKDWGDILYWQLQENVPGKFPFTAGVFDLKRKGEDPTRMFAGEGGPERTNKRFHYLSKAQPANRLSTAFDSVTLYGEDPDFRPDIYGKVGNSGVSIATLDDAKKLYSGFDLCHPSTSVSMTINGPAPIILAMFMNTAIDQQCEKYLLANGLQHLINTALEKKYPNGKYPSYQLTDEGANSNLPDGNNGLGLQLLGLTGDEVLPKELYEKIKQEALEKVRGTVQADILKEDQAQNTCIFSTEFALKLMGDVQSYFVQQQVINFYSVSISGYHIAEAGANPITQLAFTLANGFTYVEYYLSRGMHIDSFAPNLSFFFSNGMDPEYAVIGRVARRIWAKAMKLIYKGNERSQKLKYHIQTSGRSLHAQEIDFNDIRTTLQALYALYDNCNSLHTNAYDEAITTPTEESVRRAVAIQMIINKELGTMATENFIQGSYVIEALTNLVEEAVLMEFERITERGGVLGAMERMYQRNKIQEESMHYESLKHSGALPIVGVNTFLNEKGSPTVIPAEVIRATTTEKEQQITNLKAFQQRNQAVAAKYLQKLQEVAIQNGNLFEELMETVKYCSLGQISNALYEVGGQYRRNM